MTDSTRSEFEAWWDSKREANDGVAIGADYRHWALAGWQAARKAALEEAAKVCEDMRDLNERQRADKAAAEALASGDDSEALHRLRHCSTVSLFNGALERAARSIRALAEGATKEGAGD
jgi:hypothetical protein